MGSKNKIVLLIIICFIFLVFVLQINFSSVGMYSGFSENGSAFQIGETRSVRSDEWGVLTPLQLSQYYNHWEPVSDVLGEKTYISVVSGGIPTKSLSIVGKPMLWGYLLFGLEIGYSWYHVSKLFLLILFSFLLLEILTKNRRVSLIGSLIIAFSPGLQWWLTTNSLVTECIIYFEMIVVSFYYLFVTSNTIKYQLLAGIILTISLIGFVFVLYPAVQVPLVYLGFMLVIALYLDNKKDSSFSKRRILIFTVSFIVACLIVLVDGVKMVPDYIKILNTVYPGKRFITGGSFKIIEMFNYFLAPLLPFKEITFSNSSEVSSFITLFPLPLVLYALNWNPKRNHTINALFYFCLWCLAFMFIGIPIIVAKYSLWSFVVEKRLLITFGYTSTLLICCMVSSKNNISNKFTLQNVLLMIFLFFYVYKQNTNFKEYISFAGIICILLLLIYIIYLFIEKQKQFLTIFLLLTLVSGATINPIHFGIDIMTDTELAKTVRMINAENPGVWSTIDDIWIAKYLLAQGIQTINALNYPPKLDEWEKISKTENDLDIYNRYAHVKIHLDENAENKFELIQGDVFQVNLSDKDVKSLGIDYLLTQFKIENRANLFEEIYFDSKDNIYIYRVI